MRKEDLKVALAATFISRGWVALLSLLVVPVYLRFLGEEAYGVVGVFVSLSVTLGFLDLGLGATLTREMSKVPAGHSHPAEARDSARTFELAAFGLAAAIGLIAAALSYVLGVAWVTVESLSRQEVVYSLMLGAASLACQWPSNLYAGGLAGLQRQVRLSTATIAMGTLRIALTIAAISWRPSLQAFFGAQVAATFLQTLVFRYLFWSAISRADGPPKFRWTILRDSLGFAGGMTGVTLTAIILTQTDKLVLSRSLSLPEFGVYAAVSVLASGLYVVIAPLFSVMYPRFSALVHRGAEHEHRLVGQYHAASQLIALLLVPLAFVLVSRAHEVLVSWTGDVKFARDGAIAFCLLVVGNTCNGLMNMPYAMQLAYGWPRLAFWFNVASIILLVPGVWWASSRYGAVGGAAGWAILNLTNLIIAPQLMHRKMLVREKWTWYWTAALLPFALCAVGVYMFSFVSLDNLGRTATVASLVAFWGLMTAVLAALLPQLRHRVLVLLRGRTALAGRLND